MNRHRSLIRRPISPRMTHLYSYSMEPWTIGSRSSSPSITPLG